MYRCTYEQKINGASNWHKLSHTSRNFTIMPKQFKHFSECKLCSGSRMYFSFKFHNNRKRYTFSALHIRVTRTQDFQTDPTVLHHVNSLFSVGGTVISTFNTKHINIVRLHLQKLKKSTEISVILVIFKNYFLCIYFN